MRLESHVSFTPNIFKMKPGGLYGFDFGPYRPEILELYINQGKTAAETTKYLQDTYKLSVTIDQFKYAFKHLKRIPKARWTREIIPTVAKRRLEGKESTVYFQGSRVEPKRVKRSLERYRSEVELDLATAPIRVGSSIHDEVYIRSPSPNPNPSSPTPEVRDNITLPQSEQYISWSALSGIPHRSSTTQVNSSTFWLRYNLPIDQLYCDLRPNLPSRNAGHLSPLSLSNTHQDSDTISALQLPPSATRRLCQTIGIPIPLRSNAAEAFSKILRNTLSTGPWVGDLITEGSPIHAAERLPQLQLFTVAIYLASNNAMKDTQIEKLVDWLCEEKSRHLLTPLFKLRTPSIVALAEVLVDGAARYQPNLIRLLAKAGAPSECIIRALGFTKDPETVDFFASEFDFQVLKEEARTILLATAIATGKVDVVRSLIMEKVNINMSRPTQKYKICTPLIEAVKAQKLDLVQLLLDNGANVDSDCGCWKSPSREHNALSSAVDLGDLEMSQYLLQRGAHICVGFVDSFEVDFETLPQALCDILKTAAGRNLISRQDIIDAAQSRNSLRDFFKSSRIPQHMVIKAFTELLDCRKIDSALNLLEIGPLRGAQSTLFRVLDAFNYGIPFSFSEAKSLICTMHSNNVCIKDPGMMGSVIWSEAWDMSDRRAILNVLDSLRYDFEAFGPAAMERLLYIWRNVEDTDMEQTVEAILQYGVSVNEYGEKMTPFQVAAYLGNAGLIEKMLDQGAMLNREPFKLGGMTALQAAALGKHFTIVQSLIAIGADIEAAPAVDSGFTALEAAVRPRMCLLEYPLPYEEKPDFDNDVSEKVFSFLLDKEPKVLRLSNRAESPLLHDLIHRRLYHLLEEVLCMGATQHHYFHITPDHPHYTPLQLACNLGDFDAIELLVKYDADCDQSASQFYGRTALQAAISNEGERMDIVEYLIECGADVNAPPAAVRGVTALQAASIHGHFNIVRFLLEKGADVNALAAEQEGCTAVEGAAEHGRLDTVQLLLNAQATKNTIQRQELESAIQLARENRHLAVAGVIEDTLNAMCVN